MASPLSRGWPLARTRHSGCRVLLSTHVSRCYFLILTHAVSSIQLCCFPLFLLSFYLSCLVSLQTLGIRCGPREWLGFFFFHLCLQTWNCFVCTPKWFILFLESLCCGWPLPIALGEGIHRMNIQILVHSVCTLAGWHQHTGPGLSGRREACAVPSTGVSGSAESSRLQMMLLSQGASFNPGGKFTWPDMT